MRLPDPGQMFGLPRALARPLARRMRAVNQAVDEVARRYGTLHLDGPRTRHLRTPLLERGPAAPERARAPPDGLPFHDLLAASGFPVGPGPDPEPSSLPPSLLAEIAWMATKGTAWLLRRSTDLVPALVGLAVREWLTARTRKRGPSAELIPLSGNG